jgi:pSer/pThr/pTyr-binding forkhead associated (FHA) protein
MSPSVGATLRARLNGRERQFDDGREIRVGREPSSDMVSANPYVSREHAVVRRAGDGWILEDRAVGAAPTSANSG